MGARAQMSFDLAALDVHAADEHGLGPGEIRVAGRRDVFVDEPDLPAGRQGGGDQQQALRRHEGLHAVGHVIGVFEGAERGRVARKYTQDFSERLSWIR